MSISTQAAVTVATSLGASLGLPCTAPAVLRDGSNVVVHLRPAPVVARVATLTAAIRPGVAAWLTRDIAVARHLAARGVPATRPYGSPGPFHLGGAVVSLWHHEPHDPGYVPAPGEVSARLALLHAALADMGAEMGADMGAALPRLAPCADVARSLDLLAGHLPEDVLALLGAENSRLRAALAELPVRPLHGDAHPGNLLATPSGLVWNDFEDAWLGPLGWDLACLATTSRLDGAAAVAAYPGRHSAEEVATCVELRTLFGVVWRFVPALRFPHRRPEADEHLRRWLAQHGQGHHRGDHQRGTPRRRG